MSFWPVNRPPWLSGSVRFRFTLFRQRAVLQVEELFYCASTRIAPRPDSSHLVVCYRWRDATPVDMTDPALRRVFDADEIDEPGRPLADTDKVRA